MNLDRITRFEHLPKGSAAHHLREFAERGCGQAIARFIAALKKRGITKPEP